MASTLEPSEWERVNSIMDSVTAETTDEEILGLAKTALSEYNTAHAVFYLDLERKRKSNGA